ncbi:MAG: 30S ribosomal protein S16 [Chloroflexi bacterium]|nr:30S ribosomal protein S16 [Chloroflexota bacterium]
MLRIRLRRTGAKKQPRYRVVVAESSAPRDGAYVEIIGHYNPQTDPSTISLDLGKTREWLSKGATASDRVVRLIAHAERDAAARLAVALAEPPAAASLAATQAAPVAGEEIAELLVPQDAETAQDAEGAKPVVAESGAASEAEREAEESDRA